MTIYVHETKTNYLMIGIETPDGAAADRTKTLLQELNSELMRLNKELSDGSEKYEKFTSCPHLAPEYINTLLEYLPGPAGSYTVIWFRTGFPAPPEEQLAKLCDTLKYVLPETGKEKQVAIVLQEGEIFFWMRSENGKLVIY